MRILHTSDWHLGRTFHGLDLLDDQAHVLDELVSIAREYRPDIVVLAGDLYDRVVPPVLAVELMDDVLCRLVSELGLPTIAIAGNHDAAERIGFGSRLLGPAGLHVVGIAARAKPIVLQDADGKIAFHPLPFALPEQIRADFGPTLQALAALLLHQEEGEPEGDSTADGDTLRLAPPRTGPAGRRSRGGRQGLGFAKSSELQLQLPSAEELAATSPDAWLALLKQGMQAQELALRAQIYASRARRTDATRHIAIAHAFVAGGTTSDSERDLAVGGSGAVSAAVFDGFDYVALGHLHRAQSMSRPEVRYSGSLLPYSFSEVDPRTGAPQRKSVSLVEIGAKIEGGAAVNIDTVELHPRRALRVVEGTFEALLAAGSPGTEDQGVRASDDYVLARLTNDETIIDALSRLRRVFPNILRVERSARGTLGAGVTPTEGRSAPPTMRARFAAFFELVTARAMNESEDLALREVLESDQLRDGEIQNDTTAGEIATLAELTAGELGSPQPPAAANKSAIAIGKAHEKN